LQPSEVIPLFFVNWEISKLPVVLKLKSSLLSKGLKRVNINNAAYGAALKGHFSLVQWLYKALNGKSNLCSGATGSGHFEILQWAHANGCPSD
jgi:hypothetical protein